MELNGTDNALNITADDLSRDLQKALLPVTCLVITESVCGILGNVLILIVYYKWYKVCNFRCFVLCMACIDLLSSFTTLPNEVLSQIDWYSYRFDGLCKFKSFCNVYTVWASGLVLLMLAYDRNRKICHPLSWQIPTYMAGRLCVLCLVLAIVLSFPVAVFWGIQSYGYKRGNATIAVSICEKSDSYAHGKMPFIFMISALVAPMFLVMTVTVVLNVCTGKKLLIGFFDYGKKFEVKPSNVFMNTISEEMEGRHFKNNRNLLYQGEPSLPLDTLRRFSFPAGRNTLKTKLLRKHQDNKTPSVPNGHLSSNIPDIDSDMSSCPRVDQISKPGRKHHLSEDDVTSSASKRNLESWHRRVIRHRLRSRRRKTIIMLTLSTVFIVTTSIYLILVCYIANPSGILRHMADSTKVTFFLFLRMYFVNTLINPILYGFMDHRFRNGLCRLFCCRYVNFCNAPVYM